MTDAGQDIANREKTLFCEALELPVESRDAYLEAACGGDLALRHRVEQLLAQAAGSAERILPDRPDSMVLTEGAGSFVGPYRLLEAIGHGGFGEVFLAEQMQPVQRRVAIKVIKLGMETRQVVARFEAERQALAIMDHPHIAKVFDAGATKTGRPYFVMEFVRGIPITRYCDENRLSIRQRIELFIPVCQAIQHAHQKGIIHRDIKPSNVMVTQADGRPRPMVIDFGVAKAMGPRLGEQTIHTGEAQIIGTPAYMSPEQAGLGGQDVDTRSDVYALGILLYELITGVLPFPDDRLRGVGWAELERVLKLEEPARPSTAVRRLGPRLGDAARLRSVETSAFEAWIRGDLDWIVLKAIEKDRDRRYPTANGLAADLQRHLDHEPVGASPPNAAYLIGKFVRRHRTAVAAGLALLMAVTGGGGAAIWQAARAAKAERLAELRREDAERTAAEALREKSEKESVNTWLLEDLLQLANPMGAWNSVAPRGAELKLKDALILASGTLSKRFARQPLIEAELRSRIGGALAEMGIVEDGIRDLRRSVALLNQTLGSGNPRTLAAEFQLGTYLTRYYPIFSRSDPERELGLEGRRLMERCVALRDVLPAGSATGCQWSLTLAEHYLHAEDYGRAEKVILPAYAEAEQLSRAASEEAWDLQRRALRCLQWLRDRQGRMSEAYDLARQHADWVNRRTGDGGGEPRDLYGVLADQILAGYLWQFDGDPAAAEAALLKALGAARRLGGDNRRTQLILNDLSLAIWAQGRVEDSSRYMRETMGSVRVSLGPTHSDTRGVGWVTAALFGRTGDWAAVQEEYASQRRQGIVTVTSLAEALVTQAISDAVDPSEDLRAKLWTTFDQDPREGNTLGAALAMLVLPGWESELPRIRGLAEAALALPVDPLREGRQPELLRGLLALRSRDSNEALKRLSPLLHDVGDRPVTAVARLYAALARQNLGDSAAAAHLLQLGSSLLDRVLATGDLDPRAFKPVRRSRWSLAAQALLAREEAERGILGQRVSERVTRSSLAARRERWRSVSITKQRMDDAARRRDFTLARRLLDEARKQPAFHWETASEAWDGITESAAAILAACGDQAGYVSLLEELFPGDVPVPTTVLFLAGLSKDPLPDAMETELRTSLGMNLERADSALVPNPDWRALHRGVALRFVGRPEDALQQFATARASTQHDCFLLASTYGSLAAAELGRHDLAGRWRAEAAEGLEVRMSAARSQLDPRWWPLVLVDLALRNTGSKEDR